MPTTFKWISMMFPVRWAVTTSLVVLFIAQNAFPDEGMGSLRVTVKDFYDSTPIAGAQVLITPCNDSGITDSAGEYFSSSTMPYRNYQVDVKANGYIARSVGFVNVDAEQETTVSVPMKQQSIISGQVTDGLSPIENTTIILGQFEGDSGSEYFVSIKYGTTGSDGMFRLDSVDEGTYKLVALADGYTRSMTDVNAQAGQNDTFNFTLANKTNSNASVSIILRKSFSGDPLELPTLKGKRAYCDGRESTGATEFYWLKESVPAGAEPLGEEYYLGESKLYSFIIPASGDYSVRLSVTDSAGVVVSNSISFSAANVAPEAVPSVIPGPSEIPYLYNNKVYSSTSGSSSVSAGATVYLRGFAVDKSILSPEEFNPDAPCFDAYETKNGNFSASLFGYHWTLKDNNDTDLSRLLSPGSTAENVSFNVPAGAGSGDYYIASLMVTDDEMTTSDPAHVTITVADSVAYETCTSCHGNQVAGYMNTAHAVLPNGAECQDCHGLASEHNRDPEYNKISVSYWPGTCGQVQCHIEFAELQKANHSDPLPFGYYEPTEGRSTTCYKCHYTPGYIGAVESETPFHEFSYFPLTPLSVVPKDTPNVSCSVCHDPHPDPTSSAPFGLRTGSRGTACDTCHYEKWQNAILEGKAGEFENGYHFPGEDYTPHLGTNNPHRTQDKCVTCHMDASLDIIDPNGVRKIGGHTFRMRDYGNDQIPETADDILNIAGCQSQACHPGLTDFDYKGARAEIKELLTTLSNLLKAKNHGFLPANQPGKCARCHKGGTVPFLDDPEGILENAYTNYKLIANDRSLGIHNPGYVKKLLQDSINSINEKVCIATYVLGESDQRLDLLRKFRDETLSHLPLGKQAIKLYYTWTPLLVRAMQEDKQLKEYARLLLDEVLIMIGTR